MADQTQSNDSQAVRPQEKPLASDSSTEKNPDKIETYPVGEDDCIAHLKFLAAVAHLRNSVGSSVGLFDIDRTQKHPDLLADKEIQNRVREKRWQVYVSRAVHRFTRWWNSLPPYRERPTVMSLKRFELDPLALPQSIAIPFTKDDLPPLDVLMVWHAFLLNPRAYLEDCLRQAKMNLWSTPFPLQPIASCITTDADNRYTYDPGSIAQETWTQQATQSWDNCDAPLEHTLTCLSCQTELRVPWTTAHIDMLSAKSNASGTATKGFQDARGYADWCFYARCPSCQEQLNHDVLPLLRFHQDNLALLHDELPLPGTLFNPNGVVKSRQKWGAKWSQLAPNYYFMHFNKAFLRVMKKKGETPRSMRDVADFIHKDLYKRDRKIKALDLHTDLRNEKLFGGREGYGRGTLRRMMSRYWGANSSIFALDLVGAVIRQGAFIEKMQALNWLRLSSSGGHLGHLEALMKRFIAKYDVFWSIIMDNPSKMVVPTLDVDLIWHTHQLSGKAYYAYSLETTKAKKPVRFIDHNDKVDEGRLSDSFAWTVKQYRKATGGGVYSECLCWYCEATRAVGLFDKPSSVLVSLEKGAQNTTVSAHISSHNAVRAKGDAAPWRRKKLEKLIRKHHPTLRVQKDPNTGKKTSNAGHRRKVLDVFAPDTKIHSDAYTDNPSCFSVTDGADGNCIAGSCSPSMAAGSCGGSSFAAGCATGTKFHGSGFVFVQGGGGGVGGGAGCGGGC